jgi:hypothetical protein
MIMLLDSSVAIVVLKYELRGEETALRPLLSPVIIEWHVELWRLKLGEQSSFDREDKPSMRRIVGKGRRIATRAYQTATPVLPRRARVESSVQLR